MMFRKKVLSSALALMATFVLTTLKVTKYSCTKSMVNTWSVLDGDKPEIKIYVLQENTFIFF